MSKVTVPDNAIDDETVVISRADTLNLLTYAERHYGLDFERRYIGWYGGNRKAYFIALKDGESIFEATWDSDTSLRSPPHDFRAGSRHHRGILQVLKQIAESENDSYMRGMLKMAPSAPNN